MRYSSSPTVDRQRFADLIIQDLRKYGERDSIRYDPDMFSLVIGEDAERVAEVCLAPLHDDFHATAPVKRAGLVQQYCSGFPGIAVPATFAEAKARLVPLISPRSECEQEMYPVDPTCPPNYQALLGDHLAVQVAEGIRAA